MSKVRLNRLILLSLVGTSIVLLGSDESDTPSLFADLHRARLEREARERRVVESEAVPAPVPVRIVDSPIPDDASVADFDDYQYESASEDEGDLALDDDIEVAAIADSRPIGSVVSISRATRAHSPSGVASDSSISIPTSAGMSPEDEAAIAALMAADVEDDMKAVDEIRAPMRFGYFGQTMLDPRERDFPISISIGDDLHSVTTKQFVIEQLPGLNDFYNSKLKSVNLPNADEIETLPGMVKPTRELISKLTQVLEGVDAQEQLDQAAAKGEGLSAEIKLRLDAKIKTGTALIQSLDWLQTAQLIKMAIDLGVDLNSPVVIYPLMVRYLDLMRDASTQAQIRRDFFQEALNDAIQAHLGTKLTWLDANRIKSESH